MKLTDQALHALGINRKYRALKIARTDVVQLVAAMAAEGRVA